MRINEEIRAREVRVIANGGEQLGIMSSRDALKLALENHLDLVEIAPTAKPPERVPKLEGKNMIMIVAPKPAK